MSQTILFLVRTWNRSRSLNGLMKKEGPEGTNISLYFNKIENRFKSLLVANVLLLITGLTFMLIRGSAIENFLAVFVLGPILICPCLFFSFSSLFPNGINSFYVVSVIYTLSLVTTAALEELSPQKISVVMISFILVMSIILLKLKFKSKT
jgi:hypothetical protein